MPIIKLTQQNIEYVKNIANIMTAVANVMQNFSVFSLTEKVNTADTGMINTRKPAKRLGQPNTEPIRLISTICLANSGKPDVFIILNIRK